MENNLAKHNKILAITAISLVSLIILFTYFTTSSDKNNIDEKVFQVTDWKTIQQINLKSKNEEVILSFKNGAWRVNDSYKADRNLIDIIFATLIQVKPKREITEKLKDTLLSQIRKNGVSISLFSEDGKEMEWLAGGNLQKSNAYFITSGNKMYQMHIPGYRVYAAGIFELKKEEWIDKLIFDLNWINFKNLNFNVNQQKFTVVRKDNLFQIEGIETDTAKLHQFLDQLSLLQVNQYALGQPTKALNIVGDISVLDIADRPYRLLISDSTRPGERLILAKDSIPAWVNEEALKSLLKSPDFYRKSKR